MAKSLVERSKTYRICKITDQYGHYRNGITYYVVPEYFFREENTGILAHFFRERNTETLAEGLPYEEAEALWKLLRQSEGA